MRADQQSSQIIPATSPGVQVGPSPQIPLADRLKAVGLVALAGTIGVGAVLLGRSLGNFDREEALLPIPETTGNDRSSQPLRDRVAVVSPGQSAISPPETLPTAPAIKLKPRQSAVAALPRVSRGFGGNTPLATPAPNSEAGGDGEDDTNSPEAPAAEAPTSEAPIAEAPIAKAPPMAGAGSRGAVAKPQPTEFPLSTIASLLQAPQAISTAIGSMATPARPGTANSPTAARPGTGNPSPAIAPSPSATIPDPGSDSAPVTPTPGPTPAPTPTAAAPTVGNPPIAIGPPAPRKDGIYVERLPITGSTRFTPQQLALTVQKTINPNPAVPPADPSFVNRRLSPAELVQASEAITKLYTGRGYINSGAYVPADVLNGATPEIRIIEGRLETINVAVQPAGFLWFGRPLSRNYIRRRLERGIQAPLQIDQLVDAVKLLEQDPLIGNISTELAPGTTTGRSILNVKVQQAPPFHATVTLDNGRSPSVGRFQQQINLSQANLLGLGDRLAIGFSRTEGSRGFNLGYTLPINPKNGTLSFNYSNSRGQVIEAPFQDLDIKSRSQTYELALRQPLKQTSTELFALTLRGTHYSNKGVFLESFNEGVALPFPAQGADQNGTTRVTAIRFGQEWTKRSDRNVVSLQSEFSFGINALNATVLDLPPDGRFFSWQGRGFWVHSFAPDTLFTLKGQVQLANRPLVPVEQISIGGLDTVRGYRTSTLLADNGWFASAEAYLPVLRVPKWRGVLQVIPFLDIGQGWNRGNDQPSPTKLLTTGLGLQWKMGDTFRARLDWGIPLINTTAGSGRSLRESLFFSVTFSP